MQAKPAQAIGIATFTLTRRFSNPGDAITLPLTFLSTLCVSACRISNSKDMVVGCEIDAPYLPATGRRMPRSGGKMVSLAFTLDKNLPLGALISQVRTLQFSTGAVSSSFRLIDSLTDRDVDRIFDIEFHYHETSFYKAAAPAELNSLRVDVHAIDGESYDISFLFDQSAYGAERIEKLYGLWLALLDKAETDPGGKPGKVWPISPQDAHRVTILFNDTRREYPRDQCLPDLLLERVRERPDSPAVIDGEQTLTFHDLATRSFGLASRLRELGAALDQPIGICVEPSIELMTCVWGILASGAAYLPLSPEYPEARLKYMIEDSRVRIILAHAGFKEKLANLAPADVTIVALEEIEDAAKPASGACFEVPQDLRPGHLAYVIYTSGSTGRPKGVMIEHHSIVNQMRWLRDEFHLDGQTSILQKTPISFDAAQWELLAPVCGSKVVMGAPNLYRMPERMIETINRHSVAWLQCVPTLLQALVETGALGACESLTRIFVGGEALPRDLVRDCYRELPECKVINLYGPTECTINSSAFITDPESIQDGPNIVSIGAPVSNTQYYVLDNCEAPVAVGQMGELYIGGEGLARGYLHHPELTAERFIANPFCPEDESARLYRTGDLACWNPDGTLQYCGRADNQVKLRGFRIELDEIRSAIESHEWIRRAAVILKADSPGGDQNLVAFVELDSKEAALMDQGNHDSHHQSKESKAQVLMQLSNKGCREEAELKGRSVIDLPGKVEPEEQRRRVFARKTYRFYEGGAVTKDDILALLEKSGDQRSDDKRSGHNHGRDPGSLDYHEFGTILRYFGQFTSAERLLPKYGYASPGALYATQLYLELSGIGFLEPGCYYYHPVHHRLVKINRQPAAARPEFKLHFVGKTSAIEPIYKNNIQEVLEMEAGHMVGLFESILPDYGLSVVDCEYAMETKNLLDVREEDFYLGSFQVVSAASAMDESVEIYVQAHPGRVAGLKAGQYQYVNGVLMKISDEIILKKQVIAINQEVYERASFGMTILSTTDKAWMAYLNLGRKLQQLQMNAMNIGLMSSGYSSKTGYDLPSAKRIKSILKRETGASHFFLGGRVSDEQKYGEGMKEDAVHMRGPAEMINEDLLDILPDYMIPNRVVVLDKMPLTANGKIDVRELEKMNVAGPPREYKAPRNELERKIRAIWERRTGRSNISVDDNFFQLGGNSLLVVGLIHEMNEQLNTSLPLQVLFEAPTIEKLAGKIKNGMLEPAPRLVPLRRKGAGDPIFCWPGLGGYCSNLRLLAGKAGERPFYGVQAYGINPNESPFPGIKEMAAADIDLIKAAQPEGPYTLWGYSFGARVAFEAAYQLEESGETVDSLLLLAPGSPKVPGAGPGARHDRATFDKVMLDNAMFDNKTYLAILLSVFMGHISETALSECLAVVVDEESFIDFIASRNRELSRDLITRITRIVGMTYQFRYSAGELRERRLNMPATVIKAKGDEAPFMENIKNDLFADLVMVEIDVDHYSVLKDPGVDKVMKTIRRVSSQRIGRDSNVALNVGDGMPLF